MPAQNQSIGSGQLQFHRYGDTCFLSSVLARGYQANLKETKIEKEFRAQSGTGRDHYPYGAALTKSRRRDRAAPERTSKAPGSQGIYRKQGLPFPSRFPKIMEPRRLGSAEAGK